MFISNYDEIKESDELYNKDNREGRIVYSYSKRYERNPKIREKAIKYHRLKCEVCGFILKNVYGKFGEGFIEIHQNKPLYINGKEVIVDVEKDLCPVCSNCHRVLHRNRKKSYQRNY